MLLLGLVVWIVWPSSVAAKSSLYRSLTFQTAYKYSERQQKVHTMNEKSLKAE